VVADLGAGKGLAVLLAAEHPVQRVIGVELVPEIAEIARKNVERNRGRLRAGAVDIVVCDALNWPIPDDLSVVYLFSPFLDEIFHGVLERLIESIDRAPRPVRLVYSYPREHAQILRTGRARVLDVIPPGRPNRRGWWKAEFLIVTYGLGDWPYPPPRGREAPSAAVRWWSDP
jgi:SAM-dependent methyltransferase